ncbi:MAG TPA: tetratricopeptide repeat protein [bacterium]|nr:tetratricopeptide repeat protein [bacterium]
MRRILLTPWPAVALTLGLRLAYLIQIRGNPFFDSPVMDEGYHDLWAREIAGGDWAGRLPFFRAPLYPFLLSLGYRLPDGPDFLLIRGAQLLLGAVTPLLVWHLGRRLFPARPWIAAAAAVVAALDGLLFYFEADLLLEALLAPMSALLLLLVLRAGETAGPARWLAAGVVLGLFAITRPNVLLFAPVLFGLALGWRGSSFSLRDLRWRAALAVTAGACAIVLPVTAANWKGGGDPVLVASQGGLNFFLGNNAEANGWSATAPSLFRVDWWGGYEDAIRLAEEAEGRSLLPSEVSDYWYGRALDWWREHPGRGLALTARKAVLLLSGAEFGNNRDIRLFFREFAPIGLPFLGLLTVLTPLACIGGVSLARRGDPGRWMVLSYVAVYSLTIVMFFVTARYRVPLRPVIALLAVEGARVLVTLIRTRPGRGAAVTVVAAAGAVAVNVNPWIAAYDPSPAQFYQAVANLYHDNGDLPEAIAWEQRTLATEPTFPEGNLNLGSMYMELGDVPAAIAAFERERQVDPDDARNLASLAQALDRAGRTEEAERTYSEAEALGLEDAPALYNHALCLERLDRPAAEIEAMYRRALAADAAFADAGNNLGVLLARQGRLEEAVDVWRRTLEAAPGHPRLLDNLDRARSRLEAQGE